MSQELVRYLLAAGSTTDTSGSVNYFLSIDPAKSFLNCQHWKNDTLTKQELLVDSVRPGSTAAYLITPSEKLVVCITPDSKLSAYTYDTDDREWVESEDSILSDHTVHPNGKLAGSLNPAGRAQIIFQDSSQRLVSLISVDEEWTSSILPARPIAGTPISTLPSKDGVLVYYISSTDKLIHVAIQTPDGQWKDKAASKYAFNDDIKAFCVGNGEFFVLTAKNGLLKITAEGDKTVLGSVKDGKFVAGTVEEAGFSISWYPNGQLASYSVWW